MMNTSDIRLLRLAQTVVSTAVHPDTNEFVPWAFRLSSFVAVNLPLSYGLCVVAPTPFNTVFWQWVTQTYTALLTYHNRNATS